MLFLIYGTLALVTLGLAWPTPLRPLGAVLIASWVASNLAYFYLPTAARPTVYAFTDMALFITAVMVRHQARAAWMLICTLAIMGLAADFAFSWNGLPALRSFSIVTNALFALECLTVASAGLWHVVATRTGGFSRRHGFMRLDSNGTTFQEVDP